MAEDNLITKNDLSEAIQAIEVKYQALGNKTHGRYVELLLDELKAKGFDVDNPDNIKRLDNFVLSQEFLDITTLDELVMSDDMGRLQGTFLDDISNLDDNLQIIDTPTNVVDDFEDYIKNKYKNELETFELIDTPFDTVYLDTIEVKNPGSGVGSEIMNELIKFLDENNLTIELQIEPNKNNLINFYEKFGFDEEDIESSDRLLQELKESGLDVDEIETTLMRRKPDTPGGSLGAAKLNDPLVFDSWVDNYAKTTTSFVDNLPLVKPVKDLFLNAADNRIKRLARQAATPGGILDAVDIWEIGVLALVAGAIAYNEIDEIPKIGKNAILRTYNLSQGRPIDAPVIIADLYKLEISEYDIDFEYAMETLERGEKVMPTDIIIKELAESSLEKGEPAVLPGTGVTATTGIDEEFAPYKESIIKEREETARIKRDEVKQKILESKGVQEEKMFEQAKPKKSKPTGGAGAKIL